ncbi:hypothetical protein HUO13_16180 [Saccharopolyspora erythraea]|uniref:glycine-rich domain-containing protein n=1 Tax=Saccharopolyspora erythraea TaxID=1836 RepID=UPI001BAD1FD6|nr:hypothetical protein [Saccharopolyspora erythraea]QUH02123.1 hypothetical protein HUO13_16180 [Saccharopolyspora erythraea]
MTAVFEQTAARALIPDDLFSRLVERIAREHTELGRAIAARIMDQALAFLGACARNHGQPLAPSPLVDIGWHEFLMYTCEYAEFCDRVAGRFLHHVPEDVAGSSPAGDPIAVRHRTVAAIEQAGYVVDRQLWFLTGSISCSQCHNGCYDDPPPDPPPKK